MATPHPAPWRDTEKRWHDPAMTRRAILYVAAVIGAAALTVAAVMWWSGAREPGCVQLCRPSERYALSIVPGAIVLGGGIGAFFAAWRSWRGGRAWPIWQGAGWFLFVTATGWIGMSATVIAPD